MSISIQCAQCGQRYKVDAANAGKRVQCQKCGQPIVVPGASALPIDQRVKLSPEQQRARERQRAIQEQEALLAKKAAQRVPGSTAAPVAQPVTGVNPDDIPMAVPVAQRVTPDESPAAQARPGTGLPEGLAPADDPGLPEGLAPADDLFEEEDFDPLAGLHRRPSLPSVARWLESVELDARSAMNMESSGTSWTRFVFTHKLVTAVGVWSVLVVLNYLRLGQLIDAVLWAALGAAIVRIGMRLPSGKAEEDTELQASDRALFAGVILLGLVIAGRWAWFNSRALEDAVAPSSFVAVVGAMVALVVVATVVGIATALFRRIGFFNASAWSFLFLPLFSGIAFSSLSNNMPEGSWWTAEPEWWASVRFFPKENEGIPVDPADWAKAKKNQMPAGRQTTTPAVAASPGATQQPVTIPSGTSGLFDLGSVPLPEFPDRGSPQSLVQGIDLWRLSLRVPAGQPGRSSSLYIYAPQGKTGANSLPCVFIAPAGSNMLTGMRLGIEDQVEHLPYVEAGFVVVAYELDGALQDQDNPSFEELKGAYRRFAASRAGLINARNAMEFVLAKMPEVDPNRLYAAGHSSAGTLALLFAEHQPQIKGCVAYAPIVDATRLVGGTLGQLSTMLPDLKEFLVRASPVTHLDALRCPVLLFHARDDSTVPFQQTFDLGSRLQRMNRDVTFLPANTGGHYQAMMSEGIPRGIDWLQQQAAMKGRVASTSTTPGTPDPLDSAGTRPAGMGTRQRPPSATAKTLSEEEASRQYAFDVYADLLAGDDAFLLQQMRWFQAGKRATPGLRWGLGVQFGTRLTPRAVATPEDLARVTAPVGPALASGIQDRIGRGDFGNWPQGNGKRYSDLVLLGNGSRSDLAKLARQRGLDLVMLIDLNASLTRRNDQTMRIHILDAATESVLWSSDPLSESQLAAGGSGLADRLVADVFQEIDSEYILRQVPLLPQDQVRRRANVLAKGQDDARLAALVELRYYQARDMLSAADALKVYDIILGPGKGQILAEGSPAQRRQLIKDELTAKSP